MARLIRLSLILALGAATVVGISWALAIHRLDVLLGDPPPQMGTQTTTFLWEERVWRFAFAPTRIPDAPSVRVYITPLGQLAQTVPADLAARLKLFHSTGY
jgi:hypothetical protein